MRSSILIHRYSYFVDHRRFEELMELFSEDGMLDFDPGVGPVMRGRSEIRKLFGSRFLVTSHHNANVLVDLEDDDRATMCSTVYAWHETIDGKNPQT
jgi:hypothetical protein